MKQKEDHRLIDGNSFIMGFYNPSPGNPEIQSFEFNDRYLYATWEDGDKTKTEIDSIEKIYDEEDKDKEVGIYLWFGENNIYLMKMDDSRDEYDEDFDLDFDKDSDDLEY